VTVGLIDASPVLININEDSTDALFIYPPHHGPE
jgi:hypothetical protein